MVLVPQSHNGILRSHAAPGLLRYGDSTTIWDRRIFALTDDPLTGNARPGSNKTGLVILKLLVSIVFVIRESGWFSDVILPSGHISNAPISAPRKWDVLFSACATQANSTRVFDSRPPGWIFPRDNFIALGVRMFLTLKTIEELWNYQLDGTGVTVERMPKGICPLCRLTEADPREELKFPNPCSQD